MTSTFMEKKNSVTAQSGLTLFWFSSGWKEQYLGLLQLMKNWMVSEARTGPLSE